MNQVLFVIIVLVILYMFKDKWLKYMPNIVKKNVLVSGLVFGFALCYFMGNNIEGFDLAREREREDFYNQCCISADGVENGVWRGRRKEDEPNFFVEGCEATNSSGDELIPGGEAAAEGMCLAMFQNKQREQGGAAGYQAGRVARIESGKQAIREICCPEGREKTEMSDIFMCGLGIPELRKDYPELELTDKTQMDDFLDYAECPP